MTQIYVVEAVVDIVILMIPFIYGYCPMMMVRTMRK